VSQQDVATARRETLRTGPVLAGSLEPATIVRLEAQIAGTIGDLRVDRGSLVRRGQVLAVIEAQGVRGQAAGARAQVAAAEANVALMRQRMEAARTLSEAGAMSRLDYEAATSAHEAALAQLAAARAQSASASEDASRAVITSPITGAVSDRPVEEGEAVSVGNPVLTVVNTDRLELSGQIPVAASAQVRVGQPVEFSLDAYPDRQFRGTVTRMDPRADPNTRQVGVYVQLPNPGGSIIAGQFARGRVLGEAREATVLPLAAVRTLQDDSWVLAIVDGKVQRRTVTLGSRDDARGLVEIVSGVQPGEMVLAVPNAQITEGTEVTVTGGSSPTAIPGSDSAATLRPDESRESDSGDVNQGAAGGTGPNPAAPRPSTRDPRPATEER
jgi:RND family efflux transporter MFP subunit